ncbi:hypothetical protein MC885_002655 [Smutsia gigantea]|nr:hypothetical protein MC885_002655 [Smutsia gigantea]
MSPPPAGSSSRAISACTCPPAEGVPVMAVQAGTLCFSVGAQPRGVLPRCSCVLPAGASPGPAAPLAPLWCWALLLSG